MYIRTYTYVHICVHVSGKPKELKVLAENLISLSPWL